MKHGVWQKRDEWAPEQLWPKQFARIDPAWGLLLSTMCTVHAGGNAR